MSRERNATRIVKSAASEGTQTADEVVPDQLEALAREGAREMLMTALGAEVARTLVADDTNVGTAATATVPHPTA